MGMTVLTLTVPNGQTSSDFLPTAALKHAETISIKAPPSLGTAGVTSIEVSDVKSDVAVAADFADLQSDGVDVEVAADKLIMLTNIAFRSLRITTAADPGTALAFKVTINDTTT